MTITEQYVYYQLSLKYMQELLKREELGGE